jgi:hypothetical protein
LKDFYLSNQVFKSFFPVFVPLFHCFLPFIRTFSRYLALLGTFTPAPSVILSVPGTGLPE